METLLNKLLTALDHFQQIINDNTSAKLKRLNKELQNLKESLSFNTKLLNRVDSELNFILSFSFNSPTESRLKRDYGLLRIQIEKIIFQIDDN